MTTTIIDGKVYFQDYFMFIFPPNLIQNQAAINNND